MGLQLGAPPPSSTPDVMAWLYDAASRFADRATSKVPTSYDVLLILSIFHLIHWSQVKPLDPESKRASMHLYATRYTTTLGNVLFSYQALVKTASFVLFNVFQADRVKYAVLHDLLSLQATSSLLPFYWWISIPLIYALTFFTILGLLIRYPVDGMDIDMRKLNTYWTTALVDDYGVALPPRMRRRIQYAYACDSPWSEDSYSESSSADSYDFKVEDEGADEGDRVHLPMSLVLRLRRRGIDLEQWRFGVREARAPLEDSWPSWI